MAYVSWTVVAGEIPTAAKWNILGTNDASFNDGSGIGTNAIAAASLAANAITISLTTKTDSFATAATSATAITGLSAISVTIPSGGRKILLEAYSPRVANSGTNAISVVTLWDGTVGVGTQLVLATSLEANSGTGSTADSTMVARAIVTPSAGSKTYGVGLHTTTGTATWGNGGAANTPSYFLAMAI